MSTAAVSPSLASRMGGEVAGDEVHKRKAYVDALHLLRHRIALLLSLKPEALDRLALQVRIRDIGRETRSSDLETTP